MQVISKLSAVSAAAIVIGSGLATGSAVRADQVIPDDLIVQGGTCVGLDCVNGEDFSFKTLILKENNTRIFFNDTSATAGFAANKWTIVANDSAGGGQNYLGFEDTTAGRMLFKVMAGARANSLVVSPNSNVGIGKADPVLLLHLLKSDTPAVRFEQDNTGGFTAQTWDVAGNEANFFVRDATNGSRLPFRIRPGAPTSSIDIAATGFVGIGTSSPQASLHVVSSSSPTVQLQSIGATPSNWAISSAAANGIFSVRDVVANTVPFKITPGAPNNTIVIKGNGALQFSNLINCTNGIRTNASGVLSCMPAASSQITNASASAPASGVALASYNTAVSGVAHEDARGASAADTKPQSRSAGCGDDDIAGSWSLFGTTVEEGGANSVLWCDVQFSRSDKAATKYNIDGTCRSHATNASVPLSYTVSGNQSINVTQACKFGGSFSIKQGGRTALTATIVEGRIEGVGEVKTRAVGVSRWTRGKTFALQTFTMQR